jgi:hypothetical protein
MVNVPAELDEAIATLRESLAQHTDAATRYAALVQLAELLLQRAHITGEPPDEAIRIAEAVAEAFDQDSYARIRPLHSLCSAHLLRSDPHMALAYWRELRQLVTGEHPARAEFLAECGLTIIEAVVQTVEPAAVEEAISDLTVAVDGLEDGPLRQRARLCLAELCATRYRSLGGADRDREYAVETFSEALEWPGIDTEISDICHHRLASMILLRRFPPELRRSRPTDEQGVRVIRELPRSELVDMRRHLDILSENFTSDPEIASFRFNVILAQGAETTHHDWDIAAGDLSTRIDALPADASQRAHLVALRAALSSDPLPETPPAGLAELDVSIGDLRRRLVSGFHDNSSADCLVDLCESLRARAELTGDDTAKVIDIATALSMIALTDGARAYALQQLALAHAMRAARGPEQDLRPVVEYVRQLRDVLPADDPARAGLVAAIGLIIAEQAIQSEDTEHYDEIIGELDAALDHVPNSELRGKVQVARGTLHSARFAYRDDADSRARAMEAFTEALDGPASASTRDAAHAGLASLLLFPTLPDELSQGDMTEDNVEAFAEYLDPTRIPDVERHLDAISDTATAASVAPIRLLISSLHDRQSTWQQLPEVLDTLASAPEHANVLTAAELEAVHSIRSALPECANNADVERLIAAATADLPSDSTLRGMLAMPELMTGLPQDMSPSTLNTLSGLLQQQVQTLPEDAPERAQVLAVLGAVTLLQLSQDRESSPENVARARGYAEELLRRQQGDAEVSATAHFLLAFTQQADSASALETVEGQVRHLHQASEFLPTEAQAELRPLLADLLMARSVLGSNREDRDAAQSLAPDGNTPIVEFFRKIGADLPETFDPEVLARRLHTNLGEVVPERDTRFLARMLISWRLLMTVPRYHSLGRIEASYENIERTTNELRDSLNPDLRGRIPKLDALLDDIQANLDDMRGEGIAEHGERIRAAREQLAGKLPHDLDLDAARRSLTTAQRLPDDHRDYFTENAGAAFVCAAYGVARGEPQLADEGFAVLEELGNRSSLPGSEREFATHMATMARQARFTIDQSPESRRAAIDALELQTGGSLTESGDLIASVLKLLSSYYQDEESPEDRQRSIQKSLQALRIYARNVLLQSSPRRAMDAATEAAGHTIHTARKCLEADQPEYAVHALELGRGMVLHAATSATSMPELLRANGHPELADRWVNEADQVQPWDTGTRIDPTGRTPLPSDLRLQVLRALEGSSAEERLLSSTGLSEIGAGLRERGAHALVYLLAGEALMITQDAMIQRIPCPLLHGSREVEQFDRVQQELARIGEAVEPAWRAALETLCDWAWKAALGPILEQFAIDRPRIVLVPTGKFTVVPWHAARYRAEDGQRYACQDITLHYAASARQFLEAVRRRPRAWTDKPVLVRSPDLFWTGLEMEHLHDTYYSSGSYLGRPKPGRRRGLRPEEVLAALPDASLLHLGCHAYSAEIPVESALRIGGGLPVRDILRQQHSAHGALVVLGACSSDLTNRHHDEVLTLATAFLAAGASGVVGTKWPVNDLTTAVFMIVFHHFLNNDHPEPAAALRAAQLWMLDGAQARPPIPDELMRNFQERIDPRAPMHWAAFTYNGR